MEYNFKKISEVEEISEVTNQSKVVLNDNGTIKQIAANKIGGGGGSLPEATEIGSALIWNGKEYEAVPGYAIVANSALFNNKVSINQYGSGTLGSTISIDSSKTYTVIFNGEKFENVGVEEDDDYGDLCIGSWYPNASTPYPFCITNYSVSVSSSFLSEGEYDLFISRPAQFLIDINSMTNTNAKNGTGANSATIGELATTAAPDSLAIGLSNIGNDGDRSLAVGLASVNNQDSLAVGNTAAANGECSIALGRNSWADGDFSMAQGLGVWVEGESSHAAGHYNIKDTQNKYAYIIGNGDSVRRHNCFMVGWDGAIYAQASDDNTKMMKLTIKSDGTISAEQVTVE